MSLKADASFYIRLGFCPINCFVLKSFSATFVSRHVFILRKQRFHSYWTHNRRCQSRIRHTLCCYICLNGWSYSHNNRRDRRLRLSKVFQTLFDPSLYSKLWLFTSDTTRKSFNTEIQWTKIRLIRITDRWKKSCRFTETIRRWAKARWFRRLPWPLDIKAGWIRIWVFITITKSHWIPNGKSIAMSKNLSIFIVFKIYVS